MSDILEDQEEEVQEILEEGFSEDQDEGAEDNQEQEDQQEEVSQEPESLDFETRGLALQLGVQNVDQIFARSGQEGVWDVLNAVYAATNSQQASDGNSTSQQQPESESPVVTELDLSDLDDDDPVRGHLQELQKRESDANKKIEELEQRLNQVLQVDQNQQIEKRAQEFDEIFDGLDESKFGRGRIWELSQAQQQARLEAAQEADLLRGIHRNKPTEWLVKKALADPDNPQSNKPKIRENRTSRIQGGRTTAETEASFQEKFERLNREHERRKGGG